MTYKSKKISFLIDHMDPMGQGVAKNSGEITFIPKTLPGEIGDAIIYKKSKGVNFASLASDSPHKVSNQRISPLCSHYNSCQGCSYLHCSHQTELKFKQESLCRLLTHTQPNRDSIHIEVIANNDRFHYRNRIQLHYDLKKNQIGFINKITKQIHPVSNCLLPDKKIIAFLQNWYPTWTQQAKGQKPRGHVEILLKNNNIEVHWNQRYSSGGFTQVNFQMNQKMLELVTRLGTQSSPKSTLDLFGGNGNLTNLIKEQTSCERVAVDLYPHLTSDQINQGFVKLDLDQEEALDSFCNGHSIKPDLVVIDPPRKGFKYIASWCQHFAPKQIIYVSCNPATLARDLKNIPNYFLEKVFLLDMFPGTYHYETVVLLKRSLD